MPDVSVKLKDIDESNWMDVVLLTSSQGPSPLVLEEFVASNALSICQAVYEETWNIKAVYCGRKAVGFVMYGYWRFDIVFSCKLFKFIFSMYCLRNLIIIMPFYS